MIETVRVSQKGRNQLITLKRKTGISQWNVICRWAFCLSLTDPNPPQPVRVSGDNIVEMTWKTFGGNDSDIYLALIMERCNQDGIELTKENVTEQFRGHLHRGIGHLAGSKKIIGIEDLVGMSLKS